MILKAILFVNNNTSSSIPIRGSKRPLNLGFMLKEGVFRQRVNVLQTA